MEGFIDYKGRPRTTFNEGEGLLQSINQLIADRTFEIRSPMGQVPYDATDSKSIWTRF